MAINRDDLFVANFGGPGTDRLTEINTSTGAMVRVISGAAYRFSEPVAIVPSGDDLFVGNVSGNWITEIKALDRSAGQGDLGLSLPLQQSNPRGAELGRFVRGELRSLLHRWLAQRDKRIDRSAGRRALELGLPSSMTRMEWR